MTINPIICTTQPHNLSFVIPPVALLEMSIENEYSLVPLLFVPTAWMERINLPQRRESTAQNGPSEINDATKEVAADERGLTFGIPSLLWPHPRVYSYVPLALNRQLPDTNRLTLPTHPHTRLVRDPALSPSSRLTFPLPS